MSVSCCSDPGLELIGIQTARKSVCIAGFWTNKNKICWKMPWLLGVGQHSSYRKNIMTWEGSTRHNSRWGAHSRPPSALFPRAQWGLYRLRPGNRRDHINWAELVLRLSTLEYVVLLFIQPMLAQYQLSGRHCDKNSSEEKTWNIHNPVLILL